MALSKVRVKAVGEEDTPKLSDASGHYSNGFLYGNNYWTGSYRLCSGIYLEDPEKYNAAMQKEHSSITSINGNTAISRFEHENPPFMPTFFVLKLLLNDSLVAPSPRTIALAACLPFDCSPDDVTVMAPYAKKPSEHQILNVLEVKASEKIYYEMWSDPLFILMFLVTIGTSVLIVAGTIYDFFLTQRYNRKLALKKYSKDLNSESSSGIGCTTYDLTNAGQEKKNNVIGIAIPTGVNNNNSDEHLAEQMSQEEENLSIPEELILSFSLIANWRSICDRNVGSDTISCIHGLRAISMLWIILGHTCIILFKYADNMEYRRYVETIFMFQFISNAAFSVDTFFFISGFLVSFIYFRTNAKGKLEKFSKGLNDFWSGTLHFFGLLGYRFVRLTVPYMYMLGVTACLMNYFVHDSIFDVPANDHINCPKYWWRNLFYINTLFPVEDMCMLWSWYLANDTQFYIIGAIMLIIAVKHFKFAAAAVSIFLLSAWSTTAYIAFTNKHMPNTDDPFALFDKIYDKPWTRLGPYFVGMTVGWILFRTNCTIKMSRTTVTVGWVIASGTILTMVFGLHQIELSQLAAAIYSSLSHSLWALAIAWIVIACSTGYGGVVDTILSTPYIYPFSRVTYCAYLVHPMVIRYFALESDIPMHLGDITVILFIGQAVISYTLAFVLSLAFEAPVVTALRILSPSQKTRLTS